MSRRDAAVVVKRGARTTDAAAAAAGTTLATDARRAAATRARAAEFIIVVNWVYSTEAGLDETKLTIESSFSRIILCYACIGSFFWYTI